MEDDQILDRASPPPLVTQGTPRRQWHSCCFAGGTDKQMVLYFGQLGISTAILAFSFLQLIRAEGNCDRSSPYIGLISFLMGKLLASVVDSNSQAQ